MGYQVIKMPNPFCKDNCDYAKLKIETKECFEKNSYEELSRMPQINVSCENEHICRMWNEADKTNTTIDTIREIDINEIKITPCFKSTIPSDDKIAKRVKEYRETGNFTNEILLNKKKVLKDGYTQYLVCKMLGVDRVKFQYIHEYEMRNFINNTKGE